MLFNLPLFFFTRSSSLWLVMTMKREHVLSKTPKERSYDEVVSIRSSWPCQSEYFCQCRDDRIMTMLNFRSLGRLNYMRVWHDNSGSGASASWFLKYIVVRDLQTMEKNHFICQKWLGVEKDDGVVSVSEQWDHFWATIVCSSIAGRSFVTSRWWTAKDRIRLFTLEKDLSFHVRWSSLVLCLLSTTFNTIHTYSTLYVLLRAPIHVDVSETRSRLAHLKDLFRLLNIMYYDQSKEAQGRTAGGISIGPLFVTPEQVLCIALLFEHGTSSLSMFRLALVSLLNWSVSYRVRSWWKCSVVYGSVVVRNHPFAKLSNVCKTIRRRNNTKQRWTTSILSWPSKKRDPRWAVGHRWLNPLTILATLSIPTRFLPITSWMPCAIPWRHLYRTKRAPTAWLKQIQTWRRRKENERYHGGSSLLPTAFPSLFLASRLSSSLHVVSSLVIPKHRNG